MISMQVLKHRSNVIKIQHLINFYTLEKTFVWGGKTALERKEVVVNDETLTIFIPRNDVPFDIWRRSILVITYERFTKHFISKDSILRPMVYNVKVFHNERKKLYINLKNDAPFRISSCSSKMYIMRSFLNPSTIFVIRQVTSLRLRGFAAGTNVALLRGKRELM